MAASVVVVATLAPASAEPPTTDPPTAAEFGAYWLAGTVTPDGYVENSIGDPSAGATVGTALALAAAGVEGDTFATMVDWVADNVESYIVVDGDDNAGRLGYLLLLTDAAGLDPTNFAGTDLVTRLQDTLGDFAAGLYGAGDPTFDGAFRQGVAILGLHAHGIAPAGAAVTWLVDQQCDATSPIGARGGWEPYRANLATPCSAPDPSIYAGPDTNGSALAAGALAAIAQATDADPLAYFENARNDDGGFPYIPGDVSDPNSTGLVIQALIGLGEDPAAAPWLEGGVSPYTSLLSWQLGCDEAEVDRGAFASPYSDGAPDGLATAQAVWGASSRAFPFGEVTFVDGAVPCAPPITTTTTAGGAGSTTTTNIAALPVVIPRFAG